MKIVLALLIALSLSASMKEVCVNGINLKSDSGVRMLDVCVKIESDLKDYEIKHEMIMLYSSKSFEEIVSKKGKAKLYEALLTKTIGTKLYLTHFSIVSENSPK